MQYWSKLFLSSYHKDTEPLYHYFYYCPDMKTYIITMGETGILESERTKGTPVKTLGNVINPTQIIKKLSLSSKLLPTDNSITEVLSSRS